MWLRRIYWIIKLKCHSVDLLRHGWIQVPKGSRESASCHLLALLSSVQLYSQVRFSFPCGLMTVTSRLQVYILPVKPLSLRRKSNLFLVYDSSWVYDSSADSHDFSHVLSLWEPITVVNRMEHSDSPGMSDMSPLDLEDERSEPVLPQDLSVGDRFCLTGKCSAITRRRDRFCSDKKLFCPSSFQILQSMNLSKSSYISSASAKTVFRSDDKTYTSAENKLVLYKGKKR